MWSWIQFSIRLRVIGVLNLVCLLTFCLLAGLLPLNLQAWMAAWLEHNARISLFVSKDLSPRAYQELYTSLEHDVRWQNIQEFSSEQAFLLLQQQDIMEQALFDSIDKTILPITIDLHIRPEYFSQTEPLVNHLKEQNGITHVIFPQQTFKAIASVFQIVKSLEIFLLIFGSILTFFILFYLLHLIFQQHRQEIKLLALSGVSFLSIRLYYLWEVGIILTISTLLSFLITFICYQVSLHLLISQKISFLMNQSVMFYEWQDLITMGFMTLFIGEIYTYGIMRRWSARLRMQSDPLNIV